MAQNTIVARVLPRYTRADFAALRAWLNKLPLARIAALYYTGDDLELLGCATPGALEARVELMRDHLIARASLANPRLAEGLRERGARRAGARWRWAICFRRPSSRRASRSVPMPSPRG